MKKRIITLLLAALMLLSLLSGCGAEDISSALDVAETVLEILDESEKSAPESTPVPLPTVAPETKPTAAPETTPAPTPETKPTPTPTPTPALEPEKDTIDEDGEYTAPEDVALYIHTYGRLPKNFITKKEAQKLGWDSSKGNLQTVAPGMSIGGDYFGNYEGILPKGNYTECDVNYEGGYRGSERIIFDKKGHVYYTNDHYKTFTQLY